MSVIDMNTINNLKSLSKDKTFLVNVIDVFIKDTPILIADMEKAVKGKDASTLKSAAHKYKSSTRQVGATQLSALCLEVEQLALAGQQSSKTVVDKITQIKSLANQAVSALKDIKTAHLKN
ncbi:MAG: Hpt domain-containing protein [Microscillaceae bacterium]|jgi:HPt (histidine-containing phosphotransfer) domain-containing protein|nr:Hpt domain-containing protein [Microscillaceae bacterium]